MGATDLLQQIYEMTAAITFALLLVLVVRKPFRRAFGVGVAYRMWLIVPVVLIAVLLPSTKIHTVLDPLSLPDPKLVGLLQASTIRIEATQWILGIWLSGALLMAAYLMVLQRRFHRSLGSLQLRGDGLLQAEVSAGLPAVYGLLRPRIVVPADFDGHYSLEERRLMEAHERSHLAAGDLPANAMVALLRSIFWFNPLLHFAASCFRHDQELACDQRVIARHPQCRRAYGEAMFKTQLAAWPLPLGCHWKYGHPLKERIAMLKQSVPTRKRILAGSMLALALSLGTGFTAWSIQPAWAEAPAKSATADTRESMPDNMKGDVPPYPQAAVEQRLSGKVILLVEVAADGSVVDVQVEHSEPVGVFDAAVLRAAKQWKFTPSYENGKAVAGRVRVPVQFEIPAKAENGSAS